ncbi:MAG: hypothetical protein LBJ44_10685 [Propionibacteriaceae bacterium]|jgi:hypothetical protein|nr:hypothetical protein [Propionibacteriaceae bacterium]
MSDIAGILTDLAAGRIDPIEAQRLIEALGQGQPADPERPRPEETSAEWPVAPDQADDQVDPDPVTGPTARPNGKVGPIERILVKAAGRRVKITADPTVKTAMAEDVHQIKRRGPVLEISGEVELNGLGNAFNFVKSIRRLDDLKALGIGQELSIRVNPSLIVDLDVTGGSVSTDQVPKLGQVRLTAGAASLTGVTEVGDLVVQAGQASLSGCFRQGWSRLRCESGQLVVKLEPGSDVTVRAETRIGHVSWETTLEHSEQELVLGGGRARLDVGVVMGHASVRLAADGGLR